MGTRAHFGRRGGWRAVSDPEFRRQAVVAGAAGAVSMAIVACAAALARHTAGHDWYTAYRITVADLMIGAGFDKDVQVEYRNAEGVVETVAVNEHIRERLAREGRIAGPILQTQRLVSKGYTRAEKALSSNYAPGDVVVFHRPYKRLGVEKGDERRVESVDRRSRTVHLEGPEGSTVA